MLTAVSLYAFRNYTKQAVPLTPGINLFLGDNAQGKTNLLEAIYLAATSRSPRSAVLAEMVMWEQHAARVVLEFADEGGAHTLEVRLERESGPRTKRKLVLDGKPLASSALAGRVKTVLFHPEEMGLIRGSGEGRRRLLNGLMTQSEPGFASLLSRYGRVVEQRNGLLKRIAQELEPVSALGYWTEEVGRVGAEVVEARRRCLARVGPLVAERYADVAGGEALELSYAPSVDPSGNSADPAAAIVAELQGREREEVARGLTVAGPHRDDISFQLGGLPAANHASQGQQRTAILAFKLAEVEVLSDDGVAPVLLLDDVMSELDAPRREHLLALVEAVPQAVITSAEEGYFPPGFVDRVAARRVTAGTVASLQP
ncbi:MAG: DNA replication/repair protein RecF [Candidatus Dormiibacterota bacterium]